MLRHSLKRNVRLGLGVAAGSTLGFIVGNVPGAIVGGSLRSSNSYNFRISIVWIFSRIIWLSMTWDEAKEFDIFHFLFIKVKKYVHG